MHDIMKGVWAGVAATGFLMVSLVGGMQYLALPQERSMSSWIVIAIGLVLLAAGLIGMIRLERREQDKAPEFLKPMAGSFFERDGFCFAPVITDQQGQARLMLFYQSRYLNRSEATVALHPKARMPSMVVRVSCGPAAYGAVVLPIGVPLEVQGTIVSCKVGASVTYPDGRGETVRFTTGLEAGAFNSLSGGLPAGLAVVAAMDLRFVRAATVKLKFPSGVDPAVSTEAHPTQETFWKWGDPVKSL